jgi:Cu/Ag efflux protein CusF
MKKIATIALALMLGLSGAAWAGDAAGKIQAVDVTERTIVLEDGTKLWIAEGLPIDNLKEGAKVKASYEEREGKNVVTNIEVE